MKFVSNSPSLPQHLKERLAATFDVKFFGKLKSLIGWEISEKDDGITISQCRYIDEIMREQGFAETNVTWTQLPTNVDLSSMHPFEQPLSKSHQTLYRATVCVVLYLAVCTRLDISFAICSLPRHLHAPALRHASFIRRVLRYFFGTCPLGITYRRYISA